MFSFIKKIFGSAQDRLLRKYFALVKQVNDWDSKLQLLTDEQLQGKTKEFRERLKQGESLDNILPEAYATVKGACRRLCGTEVHVSGYNQLWDMVPYDVQIVGAIALHHGAIAEMQTGEGKTLTAVMPLYLNALTGKPVHLVTVNDYLAKRDCQWVGSILRWLGIHTAALTNDTAMEERPNVYAADVVYGTASEFGFDYLRDNSMAMRKEEQVQRGHYFAIIDEVDSILIDEARTPLIISGPAPISRQMYEELKSGVADLVKQQRDLCTRLANEAKRELDALDVSTAPEHSSVMRRDKQEQERYDSAMRKLWLVSKGMPRHKLLTKIKEDPEKRASLDKWDLYYYNDQNKQEKIRALADLYIIVDERSSEFELTDKGIHAWVSYAHDERASNDFVMLDISHEYMKIDEDHSLSDQDKVERKLQIQGEDTQRKERAHNLRQMLRAHLMMERDVDYILQENKIIIIDEHTGRPQPGRRFSDGLHQAIEAKEGAPIQRETQTYATITLQNYFRMYEKLAGMTGTAMTEANEFKQIYKLEVMAIPTYLPCQRRDVHDEIYMTEREKYQAILKEIHDIHSQGRPILIGTESVDISEKLARICRQNGLDYTVLNAKNHEREAEIVANAGQKGAITISTNMAGRGTDIKLAPGVAALGGLHVIGTTRHQSRRIDRQLRGRSARLGDPGSSKFFVSFEDSLLRLFAAKPLTNVLQRFRPPEGEPIGSAAILSRSIETAQKRVEQRNYSMRKHTLEYDDVMNKQRQAIYAFRNEILCASDILHVATELLYEVCASGGERYFKSKSQEGSWDVEGFTTWLMALFPLSFDQDAFDVEQLDSAELGQLAAEKVIAAFREKINYDRQQFAAMTAKGVMVEHDPIINGIRNLMLRNLDRRWQEHLLAMDHLRTDVSLRAVGQRDPLMEFKHEAFALFDALDRSLKEEIAKAFFRFQMVAMPQQLQHQQRELFEQLLSNLRLETQRPLGELTLPAFADGGTSFTQEPGNNPER